MSAAEYEVRHLVTERWGEKEARAFVERTYEDAPDGEGRSIVDVDGEIRRIPLATVKEFQDRAAGWGGMYHADNWQEGIPMMRAFYGRAPQAK